MKIPWEQIEELTKYLKEKGLNEITIETKDGKITVKKDPQGKIISTMDGANVQDTPIKANGHEITSPMVGTFYSSPSPGAEPFVQVGSKVKAGDVLCIIEAMKIMNELTSEVDGTIKEILVKENQTVEYGQLLMIIE